MVKRKLTIGSSLLFIFQTAVCQQFNNFNFLIKNADKITISTISFVDKTTATPSYRMDSISKLPYPVDENTKETITNTGTATLTHQEHPVLLKKLETIGMGHALPYQYDIQFDFYLRNKIVQTITISSYTKNLVIKTKGCKTYVDKDGQETDPCFFQGMVSDKLKKYVVSLLKSKKLWNKEQQFFEDDK